jgi:ribosomal protein S18 acetylase RimI-like enzyme
LRQEILRKPLGLNLFDEDLEKERDQWHFGLFDAAGVLVGCVIVLRLSSSEARIRQMAIAREHQGQGHGRRMLAELETLLAARGFSRLLLHARASAIGFYEKLGYSVVGEEFVEVTIPHVRMGKKSPLPPGEG